MNEELLWRMVPRLVVKRAERSAATAEEVCEATRGLPKEGILGVYHGSDDRLALHTGSWADPTDVTAWKEAMAPLCRELTVTDRAEPDYIRVWWRPAPGGPCTVKQAYDRLARGLGQALNMIPAGWNSPSPLASTITGGVLGAGLGYGAGWLGEKILPSNWQRGRLRRTLAALGGLAGTLPGAAWAATNVGSGYDWNDPNLFDNPSPDVKTACRLAPGEAPQPVKRALYDLENRTGYSDDYTNLPIPVDDFQDAVWNDPRVAGRLSPIVRAAASGLVEGAAHHAGTRLISPLDMARITAGMGTGLLSGAVVGKALGALMGMPETDQARLRQSGAFAGLVANLVPLALGAA